MSDSLVIFLHGVGSRGADLEPLAELWRPLLPETRFAVPDAPFGFDGGGNGRQWFSISGVTEDNRGTRLVAAREPFDRVIATILAENGFTDRLDRVALVGFSQGSIMALDAVASGRWPVGAVVAFAGRLASPAVETGAQATPIMLIHGTADPVMPIGLCAEAEQTLSAAGFTVHRHDVPGAGHQITRDGAELAGRFLADALGQNSLHPSSNQKDVRQ